ncbi:DUF86 domain-containing protein [Patescibacteria group bacterium]|nr:DUF86 domain-containing protein [Patescibacteria group bacterium]
MINNDFIKRKISLIEEELVRLKEFSQYSFEEIVRDFKKQAIVERLLERIISRALDINQHLISELYKEEMAPPKSYKETFLRLAELEVYPKDFGESIAKSVGTRNILVHEYDEVDYSRIYSSVADCLKDYRQYCDYILRFLEKN